MLTLALACFALASTAILLPGQRQTENVLLVTLDGLRWQDVFGGADNRMMNVKANIVNTMKFSYPGYSELWQWMQQDPQYQDKTTLVLTVDHGRGRTPRDWIDHGKNVAAVLGEDFQKRVAMAATPLPGVTR